VKIDVIQSSEPGQSENWTIRSDSDWLVSTVEGGVGSSLVRYQLAPNRTGAPRTGTLQINDKILTVTQTGKWHVPEFAS